MPFVKVETRTPTSIGRLTITVSIDVPSANDDGTPTTTDEATYDVEILDQNGLRLRDHNDRGNLIPLLSTVEKTQILNFMQAQKDKAIAGFLQ